MSGVEFPVDESGARSTTNPAKAVWEAAFKCVDEAATESLRSERNWRKNYGKHVTALTRASVKSPELTLEVAQNGIQAVYETFDFVRGEETMKLGKAMNHYTGVPLTGAVKSSSGVDCNLEEAFSVQIGEEKYKGDDLVGLVEKKFEAAELEEDVVEAFRELQEKKRKWREELNDTVFVLLGATSELCPFEKFMELGLSVAAVARPNAKRQKKLIDSCLNGPSGASLYLPVLEEVEEDKLNDPEFVASVSGADVITHAPELANWLVKLAPGKRLVIGSYIYLDGADHVRASVAMDAVAAQVIEKRPGTGIMYLGTPSIVYPICKPAYEDSLERLKTTPWWHAITKAAFGPYPKNMETPVIADSVNPNAEDQSKEIYMLNAITNVQGPNYLLAKTLQIWRGIVARQVNKSRVSMNMTPVCRTDSVMHVPLVARAVHGMKAFAPLVSYEPSTARDLMALLVIYDICSDSSAANPSVELRNPMEITATCSVHGGLWRCPYRYEAIGKTAVILNYLHLA